MTSTKNLWGELSSYETLRTPYTILKEQASILTEITNGLLMGEVKLFQPNSSNRNDLKFIADLNIKVPSLNNYTYAVVSVEYSINLYPLVVNNYVVNDHGRNCSSEEEFENALGEILSSEEVKKVISALLSQIHADIPKS